MTILANLNDERGSGRFGATTANTFEQSENVS